MFVATDKKQKRFENWLAAPTLEEAIADFEPIGLDEIGEAALLDRVETKYVVSAEMLPIFLRAIEADYRVLNVAGKRLNRYKSLYFDSAEFSLYHRHHAGGTNRYKVRSRQYVETGTAFLEIKHKNNKKRTHKERIETDQFLRIIDRPTGDFLRERCPHNIDAMFGRLISHYSRITLVNRHTAERVTIDLDLTFEWEDRQVAFPAIAIIEIKRAPHSAESPAITQLRKQHCRPQSFSKYCIGISQIYPQVKHNNFKQTLRYVNKLSQGNHHVN